MNTGYNPENKIPSREWIKEEVFLEIFNEIIISNPGIENTDYCKTLARDILNSPKYQEAVKARLEEFGYNQPARRSNTNSGASNSNGPKPTTAPKVNPNPQRPANPFRPMTPNDTVLPNDASQQSVGPAQAYSAPRQESRQEQINYVLYQGDANVGWFQGLSTPGKMILIMAVPISVGLCCMGLQIMNALKKPAPLQESSADGAYSLMEQLPAQQQMPVLATPIVNSGYNFGG